MRSDRLNDFIAQKRRETVLGYARFGLASASGSVMLDGIMNIGERMDGKGGFLVLSCLMDIPLGQPQKDAVRKHFGRLTFAGKPPPGLLTMVRTDVRFEQTRQMMMEELTCSFSRLDGMQRQLVTRHLIPMLKRAGFAVGQVQWVEEATQHDTSILKKITNLDIVKLFG